MIFSSTITNILANASDISDARAMCFAYIMGATANGNTEFAMQKIEEIRAAFRAKFGKDC